MAEQILSHLCSVLPQSCFSLFAVMKPCNLVTYGGVISERGAASAGTLRNHSTWNVWLDLGLKTSSMAQLFSWPECQSFWTVGDLTGRIMAFFDKFSSSELRWPKTLKYLTITKFSVILIQLWAVKMSTCFSLCVKRLFVFDIGVRDAVLLLLSVWNPGLDEALVAPTTREPRLSHQVTVSISLNK